MKQAFWLIIIFWNSLNGHSQFNLIAQTKRDINIDSIEELRLIRICYFGSNAQKRESSCLLAQLYVNQQQYLNCISFTDTLKQLNDSWDFEIAKTRLQCFFALNQFNKAQIHLEYMLNNAKSPSQKSTAFFYGGLIAIQQRNKNRIIEFTDSIVKDLSNDFVRNLKKIRRKYRSKTFAVVLNILPGLGEAYCNEWGRAYRSLVFHSAFAAVIILGTKDLPLISAVLSVQWGLRYYIGGFKNASLSAEYRNELIDKKLTDYWLQYIETARSKSQ